MLIILGYVAYSYGTRKPVVPYETTTVKRANVVQEVSVTGSVNSESQVDLSFDRGGKVVRVAKDIGDHVARGDLIAAIDVSELSALRMQAEANLEYEIVHLAEIKQGARAEDIAVSESQVESAQQALSDANRVLVARLRDAYTKADDAVRNLTDILFANPRTSNPMFLVPVADAKLITLIPPDRVSIESLLTSWSQESLALSETKDVGDDAAMTEISLNQVKSYLEELALAVNSVNASTDVSRGTIDGWKAGVSTARANINITIANVLAADQTYRSAKSALAVAENQLALKKAGATSEEIAAQEAKIASMRATVTNYDAQITKFSLRSPIAGTVTRQDAKLGQTVAANMPIATVQGDGKWKIEANIPEVDISKISVGNHARITLDAFGSDKVFSASISMIDPAEVVIEGVPTYKVTLQFDQEDPGIRSGMTANIDIRTDEKENVLSVPSRAVLTKDDGTKVVRIPDGNTWKEATVTTGLRGSDGTTEILTGVNEGEAVITFIKGS